MSYTTVLKKQRWESYSSVILVTAPIAAVIVHFKGKSKLHFYTITPSSHECFHDCRVNAWFAISAVLVAEYFPRFGGGGELDLTTRIIEAIDHSSNSTMAFTKKFTSRIFCKCKCHCWVWRMIDSICFSSRKIPKRWENSFVNYRINYQKLCYSLRRIWTQPLDPLRV